jgi:hypothetical protein
MRRRRRASKASHIGAADMSETLLIDLMVGTPIALGSFLTSFVLSFG